MTLLSGCDPHDGVKFARDLLVQSILSLIDWGPGEAAVIQIAVDEGFLPAAIDEVSGRRAARLAGLRVIGSLGILVELHHAGCLPSLADSIRAMQSKGIYLAPHLIEMALDAARPRPE